MKGVFISNIEPKQIFINSDSYYYYSSSFFNIYQSPKDNFQNSKSLNIKDIEWRKCTVGNSNTHQNYIDENIRNGYFSRDNIKISAFNSSMADLLTNIFDNNIFISVKYNFCFTNDDYQPWKMLRYDENGFFQRHSDGIRNENHFATGIIIPPLSLNKYEGGELVLYRKDEELVITADENNWKLVVFALDIEHELKLIKSGQRIVFVCPFDYNKEMKYLLNNTIYKESLIIKTDEQTIFENKKSILEKIEKLENDILEYRKILNGYDYINDYILQELIDEILKQLKITKNNGFIVGLKNYYTKPIPTEFCIKDSIVYNTIVKYFKEQNIEIRIMNFGCKINNGDGTLPKQNKIILSTNCEGYTSKNKEDDEPKFKDYDIICPNKFYDLEYIGEVDDRLSVYNDSTYDDILILKGTFLHCTLKNVFFEE
jgi:hypothetical protein